MIEIGADKPPQTNPNAEEHRAQIARYVGRIGDEVNSSFRVVYAARVTTTASSQFTTVSDIGAKTGDVVLLSAMDSVAAAMAGIIGAPGPDTVSIIHPSQATTGVFSVLVVSL